MDKEALMWMLTFVCWIASMVVTMITIINTPGDWAMWFMTVLCWLGSLRVAWAAAMYSFTKGVNRG